MASLTQWTWVWVSSGSWWRTGNPDVLQFMGLQRVGQDWGTEKQQIWIFKLCVFVFFKSVFWRPSRRILSYTPSCYSKYEKLPAPISWFNEVLLCWWLFIFLSSLCCCELTLSKYWISIQPHSYVWSPWLNGKHGQTLSHKGNFLDQPQPPEVTEIITQGRCYLQGNQNCTLGYTLRQNKAKQKLTCSEYRYYRA